jgi:hypothetical protein
VTVFRGPNTERGCSMMFRYWNIAHTFALDRATRHAPRATDEDCNEILTVNLLFSTLVFGIAVGWPDGTPMLTLGRSHEAKYSRPWQPADHSMSRWVI